MPAKRMSLDAARRFAELPMFPARTKRLFKDSMGLELEIEFKHDLNIGNLRDAMDMFGAVSWNITKDGSLRGHGYEFISKPLGRDNLAAEVTNLFKAFKSCGLECARSHRTSTHVHLNFSKNTLLEAYQFLLLYYFLEPTLFCLTEEDRWHNTFCVSSGTTSSDILSAANDRMLPFWKLYDNEEHAKYASLNLVPYTRLGTFESRIYHGADNAEDVVSWLTALQEIKQYAVKFKSLKALYKKLEDTDFKLLLKEVFVTTFPFVSEHIAMREKNLYKLANEGNARAYPLVFIERRLEEANAFLTEELKKIKELSEKQQEKERMIENYDDFF